MGGRHGGTPGLGEVVEEGWPGPGGLDVVDPVGGVGHAATTAERVGHRAERARRDGDEAGERGHERLAVAVEEHGGVLGGESVTAGVRRFGRVVDGEDAGHRLLLEQIRPADGDRQV